MEPRLVRREAKAYRLLKQHGFCERGEVPDFHGMMERIDVDRWPDLSDFQGHRLRPDAIFIEYIPNMEAIGLKTFRKTI